MSSDQIAVICHDGKELETFAGRLRDAGARVKCYRALANAVHSSIEERIIFCVLESIRDPLLSYAIDRGIEGAQVILALPRCELGDILRLMKVPEIKHVASGDDYWDEFYLIASKILSGDIFGIEKYLPAETSVERIRLKTFSERKKAIDSVLEYAEAHSVRKQIRASIAQVCEELLMNALYDAPVDEYGKSVFAEVDPHDRTKMESPKLVTLRFAVTDTEFVVAVRDRFGRLDQETVLAFIDKCLNSENQIDDKNLGAGLGLYYIASSSCRYIVNVAAGIATEVVCSFDKKRRSPLRLIGHFSQSS